MTKADSSNENKKKSLKQSTAKIDAEGLKVFSDNPKMAVTVISFVTSAGAIVYRLAISAANGSETGFLHGVAAFLFIIGLILSLYSIILSYRMIGTITACYLDILDDDIDNTEAEAGWNSIRLNQGPWADLVMILAVVAWMFVILISAFII